MKKIQIYVMTHKKFEAPWDPLYQPLQVGRAVSEELGYLGDDTGENISALNCYYSELTGLYWVWKNCKDVEYVGTCHYRRYLLNEKEKILSEAEYAELFKEYDLITTKKVLLNHSYHYGFAANHNIKALDVTGEVIQERYPEYYDTYLKLVNGPETYFGNMIVTSKKLYDAYAQWLFSIFFEVAERIDLDTDEDAYHKRVFGFISEFLLLVWTTVQGLRVKECKVGMLGEKAETKEMKQRLAVFFEKRDAEGAKAYFLKRQEERPDVLMEASDITGELRLCMQIIATAGLEKDAYGTCVLDRENQYHALIEMFEGINRVICRTHSHRLSGEDIEFLNKNAVTELALEIAAMLLLDSAEEREEILSEIKEKEMI